jgi:GT2 family glycosyltransferase
VISVIICSRNRASDLTATLDSLLQVRLPDVPVEVILVDSASTDDTPAIIRKWAAANPQFRVEGLHVRTPGKSVALNAALAHAQGDALLFSDDDVRFPSDWIRALASPLLNKTFDAVQGAIVLPEALQRPWAVQADDVFFDQPACTDYLISHRPRGRTVLVGANMGIHRRVFELIGGFDPLLGPGPRSLGLGEDTLLSYQIVHAGFRIGDAEEAATVEHHFDPARLSRASGLKSAIDLGRSRSYIKYHWNHAEADEWASPSGLSPRLTVWKRRLRLLQLRLRNRWRGTHQELTKREYDLVRTISDRAQFQAMAGTPRHYEKNGLHFLGAASHTTFDGGGAQVGGKGSARRLNASSDRVAL